jgi:hypothetical protein
MSGHFEARQTHLALEYALDSGYSLNEDQLLKIINLSIISENNGIFEDDLLEAQDGIFLEMAAISACKILAKNGSKESAKFLIPSLNHKNWADQIDEVSGEVINGIIRYAFVAAKKNCLDLSLNELGEMITAIGENPNAQQVFLIGIGVRNHLLKMLEEIHNGDLIENFELMIKVLIDFYKWLSDDDLVAIIEALLSETPTNLIHEGSLIQSKFENQKYLENFLAGLEKLLRARWEELAQKSQEEINPLFY